MEHPLDFTFVSMTNVTLCRRDSYLAHVKSGLKQDTLAALHQAPLNFPTLLGQQLFQKGLTMILADLRTKVGLIHSLVAGGTIEFTLTNGRIDTHRNRDLANHHGNNLVVSTARRKVVDSQTSFPHLRTEVSDHINDKYCVKRQRDCKKCKFVLAPPGRTKPTSKKKTVNLYQCHQTGSLSGETVNVCQLVISVNSVVVNHAHIVQGHPQRKGASPAFVRQCQSLKYVNNLRPDPLSLSLESPQYLYTVLSERLGLGRF